MESFLAWMIESSLLILMIFGIRKVFSGRISYAGLYALWLVILLRFLIPVNFISTPVSVANLVTEALAVQEKEETDLPVQSVAGEITKDTATGAEGTRKVTVSYKDNGVSGEDSLASADDTDQIGLVQQEGTDVASVPRTEASEGLQKKRFRVQSTDWMPIFTRVRICLSALLFLWIFLSNIRLLRKLKDNRVLYGERGPVQIYVTQEVKSPCLYGFLHPAVYLPAHLVLAGNEDMQEDELEQMITHEVVHYRHKDHIWAILRIILVSVYWFHPLLWMAVSASKKDAELYCDETVIRLLGEEKRFRYGEMLVRLAGDHSWGDFRYSMMPMSRRGREMERRILAISMKKRYSKWVAVPLVCVLLIAVGITSSAGYGPLARERNQTEEHETASGTAVEEETAGAAGQSVQEQISSYAAFLKEQAAECQYYSLAWLSEDHVVLLTSDHVAEIRSMIYGSTSCRIYNVVGGEAVYCGEAACGSSGEWIHLSDGRLLTNSHHSVTRTWIGPDSDQLTAEENTDDQEDTASEYPECMKEFAGAGSIVFYSNPYTGGKSEKGIPEIQTPQDQAAAYIVNDYSYDHILYYEENMGFADTPEQAFENYMKIFTEAVNTGNTDKMHLVLAVDSEVYDQQCALVKNYYKRGIREEVKSCSAVRERSKSKMQENGDTVVGIASKEKIQVFYADGSTKLIKQKYRYTCTHFGKAWLITRMEAI